MLIKLQGQTEKLCYLSERGLFEQSSANRKLRICKKNQY